MFHAANKIFLALGLTLLASGGWLIYESGLVQDAWWICGNRVENSDKPLIPVTGHVTSVISGNEFYLQLTNQVVYRMAVSGIKKPRPKAPLAAETDPARLLLSKLIDQQTVTIHRGYFARNHAGKGFVEVGGTNVTRVLVASRLGTLDREQIRPLPFAEQYGLLRAERKARP